MTREIEGPAGEHASADTVAALVHAQVCQSLDDIALLAPRRAPLTYRELWSQTERIGAVLHGIGTRSPRVAVGFASGPEMAAAFIAVSSHATCVPIDPAERAPQLRTQFVSARVDAVMLEAGKPSPARVAAIEGGLRIVEVVIDPSGPAGALRPLLPTPHSMRRERKCSDADAALVLQTSGSTGTPKLVELCQRAVVASARDVVRHFGLSPKDCCLNVRPLFHVNGLIVNVLATLASGGRVVFAPMGDADAFFDVIASLRPTWFSGVPTMHRWFLRHGETYRRKAPKHRFRFVRSGAAPLPPTMLRELEALTGAPVIEAYGMTERTPIAANPLPPGIRKPGTVGRPVGVEVALLDEQGAAVPCGHDGEIAIRGSSVGTAGTWLRTGDLGRFDNDGYLSITGRLKEQINRGGQKVAPREVEECLLEHPAIAEAAVFAVSHSSLGEDVAAAVVLRLGHAVDRDALRSFLLGRLSAHKVPSTITVVAALPVGPTGKVQRGALPGLPPVMEEAFLGDTERRVAALFVEVLGLDRVRRHDSFFHVGGDSIQGTRVLARIAQTFGVELTPAAIFRYPTVADLAGAIDKAIAQADEVAAQIAGLSDDEVLALLAREDTAAS